MPISTLFLNQALWLGWELFVIHSPYSMVVHLSVLFFLGNCRFVSKIASIRHRGYSKSFLGRLFKLLHKSVLHRNVESIILSAKNSMVHFWKCLWKMNTEAIPQNTNNFFLSKALLKKSYSYYLPRHDSLYKELVQLMKEEWKINVFSHLKGIY